MVDRLQRKEEFIKAAARFLGGTNQAVMSIALAGVPLPGPQAKEIAEVWRDMRTASPLHGYPTIEEAEAALRDFLG